MRTFDKTIEEILAYGKLKPGWSGEISYPPKPEMVKLAAEWVNSVPKDLPPPQPMLSWTGTIGVYWDRPQCYIDVEFDGENEISVYIVVKRDAREDKWFPDMQTLEFTHQFFLDHFQLLKEEQPWTDAGTVAPSPDSPPSSMSPLPALPATKTSTGSRTSLSTL